MTRPRSLLAPFALAALGGLLPVLALAQPKPAASGSSSSSSARPAASPSARPLASLDPSARLPMGHPPVDDDGDEEQLPAGHPPTAGAGASERMGMPKENASRPDPTLPAGTIAVELRDEAGKPLPRQDVILGIVVQSISQGESRKRLSAASDEQGVARFDGLDRASQNAYRVSVVKDGATYAAPPFQLPREGGMRVSVSVYPVVTDVKLATLALQGILYVEIADENLKLEQGYRIFNVGHTAWVPDGASVALPAGFKAFNAQKSMDGIDWDAGKDAAKLRGTIAPGLHETAFRYQVANDESEEMVLDLGILPNVQAFRVIVDAPRGMTLTVDGFPPAQRTQNQQGTNVLFTEKQTERLEPNFRTVHLRLGGLPTRGNGRVVATVLAVIAILAGLYVARRLATSPGATPEELAEARRKLLGELDALEKARASGEIGPKTYEHARRALVDALARVLAQAAPAKSVPG